MMHQHAKHTQDQDKLIFEITLELSGIFLRKINQRLKKHFLYNIGGKMYSSKKW